MKLKRNIAFLLCFFMISCVLPGFPVFADSVVIDTIEEVIATQVGRDVKVTASSHAWDFANSTMDTYTRAGALSTPDGAKFTQEGLDLGGTNGTDEWRFYPFKSWSPMCVGANRINRATYVKVKGEISISFTGFDTKRLLKIHSVPGSPLKITGDATTTKTFTPGENWVEYLLIPQNTNAVHVWVKDDIVTNGHWVYQGGSGAGLNNNDAANNVGIHFAGSGVVAGFKTVEYNENAYDATYVDEKIVATEEEAKSRGDSYLYFEEEFDQVPEAANISLGNAVTVTTVDGEGVAYAPVSVTNPNANNGRITFHDLAIPVGGYAEFKIRSNGEKKLLFDDGITKWELTLNCDYSSMPGSITGGGYVSDSDMAWRTWRLVRTEKGYNVYSQTKGDSGWRIHAVDGISGNSDGNGKRIAINFSANCNGIDDGNGQLAYLKVYAPALSLTDGDGTEFITCKEEMSDPKNASAVVMRDSILERRLLFAEYGTENQLMNIEIFPVSPGEGTLSIPLDMSDEEGEVQTYKVFLWDDFSSMISLSTPITIEGNSVLWTDAWEFGGKGSGDSGIIVLNTTAEDETNAESYAEWNTEVEDACDVSWTMEVERFNGSETVEVYTGTHRISLGIAEDEISYLTNSGIKTTPWTIGSETHQYRLIHNNGTCDLLIDGYHVAELIDVQDSAASSKIRFQNARTEDEDSRVVVESVRVDAYATENVPVATQRGFYHSFDFEDEAITAEAQYERLHSLGWEPNKRTVEVDGESVSTPFDDNGNLISAWEINEGNLQISGFKSREINSTVQKYFKENVGDDYIFLTRMRIPEFGTTGQINLYLKNRVLSMNLKQMFFGMRTAYSNLASADSGGETAYSDPIMIDTDRWYDFRIETYGYCKYARIYLDDVKIMEAELAEYAGAYYAFNITSQSGWTEPFDMKFDYIKCAPINYKVAFHGLADGDVYQEGDAISLSATVQGAAEGVVQYLMNGNVVATGSGTNHGATLTGLPAGSYKIQAVCGKKFSTPISIMVEKAESDENQDYVVASSNYANEVSYKATGDGVAEFCNGIHLLKMNHQGGTLQYETDEGIETYSQGIGHFQVVTEGPVAEVYRNGQFAFSFYMPMVGEEKQSFSGEITDVIVSASPERRTHFSANNVTDQKRVYEMNHLSHSHVLDFVAGSDDAFHIVLNDGYYRTDVSVENGEMYVWNGQRNNSLMEKMKVATLEAEDIYYRVETSAGMSRLYRNGRWITTFRGAPTVGESTLAVNVTAGALKYLAVCDNTDLYLYEDDFSGNGEVASKDFWMTSNDMVVSVDEEVLSLESSADNGIAELSSSCGNVDLSAKVSVESGDGFWFVVNHVTANTYTKVGYQDGKYQIIDVVNTREKQADGTYLETITETLIQEVAAVGFPNGANLNVQVAESAEGKRVTLFVDGTEVISGTTEIRSRGMVGFMLANGKATIDDVAFRGDAKPLVGFTYFYAPDKSQIMDMIEVFDTDAGTSEVYIVNGAGQGFATSDGGKTWSLPEPILNEKEKTIGYFWSETEKKILTMSSNHIYQFYHNEMLENGKEFQAGDILAIREIWGSSQNGVPMEDEYGGKKYATCAISSNNYGESWNAPSFHDVDSFFLKPEEIQVGDGSTVNTLKRGASGRFYFVQNIESNEDYGGARVWWSDDTETWTPSETKISAKGEEFGFVIAEAIVIETGNEADGYKTRLYFRTDMGTICYLESPDRGVTWDSTPHSTPFISSACCFNIEADPMDESGNTLYIAWSYDNTNLFARHQFPRTRASVAKSTDGGETWEMIGTVRENNSTYQGGSQNMNISVSSQHVYVTAYTSEQYGQTSPFSTFIAAFPKDSQKTSKRFEQLHLQHPTQVENTRVMPEHLAQSTMVIHPNSSAVWLHGKRFEDAVYGSYVSLDCAAALVGATVEKHTGSVVFRVGDKERRFYLGSILNRDGVWYVSLSVFANEFGLSITEEDGIKIVSEHKNWSQRQKKAFRYGVDLFSKQP